MSTPFALVGTAAAAPDSTWDSLAQCESGGRWNVNTGNGYSGGLQFSPSTWKAFGGSGSAHQAGRGEQIAVAERVLASQGWNAWPSCSRKVGARGESADTTKVKASAPAEKAAQKGVAQKKDAQKKDAPKKVKEKASEKAAAPKKAEQEAAPKKATVQSAPVRRAPVAAASLTKDGADYTVVAGDTLSKIAERENVAGGWQSLFERNADVLSNPNVIRIGQQLDLR